MKNVSKELELKAIQAAKNYLVRGCGMEILNEEPFECEAGKIAIVAKDANRGIVFVDVAVGFDFNDDLKCGKDRRRKLEKIAIAFLAGFDEANMAVGFDELAVAVIGSSKALVRYRTNMLSDSD